MDSERQQWYNFIQRDRETKLEIMRIELVDLSKRITTEREVMLSMIPMYHAANIDKLNEHEDTYNQRQKNIQAQSDALYITYLEYVVQDNELYVAYWFDKLRIQQEFEIRYDEILRQAWTHCTDVRTIIMKRHVRIHEEMDAEREGKIDNIVAFYKQRDVAFALVTHRRVGAGSIFHALPSEVVRTVLGFLSVCYLGVDEWPSEVTF
jgi:hypothetical protein